MTAKATKMREQIARSFISGGVGNLRLGMGVPRGRIRRLFLDEHLLINVFRILLCTRYVHKISKHFTSGFSFGPTIVYYICQRYLSTHMTVNYIPILLVQ